ncbi:uncharacterized protein DS421_2g51950 [Arachis hypogaea]|nr:uncharacterized protein DS421_2g51950 [Arachis hypogaea]
MANNQFFCDALKNFILSNIGAIGSKEVERVAYRFLSMLPSGGFLNMTFWIEADQHENKELSLVPIVRKTYERLQQLFMRKGSKAHAQSQVWRKWSYWKGGARLPIVFGQIWRALSGEPLWIPLTKWVQFSKFIRWCFRQYPKRCGAHGMVQGLSPTPPCCKTKRKDQFRNDCGMRWMLWSARRRDAVFVGKKVIPGADVPTLQPQTC